MRNKLKWIVPLAVLLVVILVVYLYPVPRRTFEQLSSRVDPDKVASLQSFRQKNVPKVIEVDGKKWEYISTGRGNTEAILFLHGMTGSADIWWQQIEALRKDYRIIAVTYSPANSLREMDLGVMTILANEHIPLVNIVGTSLGGYYAQYFAAKHPQHVTRLVLSNTFAPNDLIKEKNGTLGSLLPVLPNWLIMNTLRNSIENSIYPASGNDELTRAFLLEMTYGKMSKAQFASRYRCVIDQYPVPDLSQVSINIMIIESDNDPLVEAVLRQQLIDTYPTALLVTLKGAGHFPYLNRPDEYTELLRDFLRSPIIY